MKLNFRKLIIGFVACFLFAIFTLFTAFVKQPAKGQIYIYSGSNDSSATGGVISLATTDAPAISITGDRVSGDAKIEVYKANDDALLDYITHNDKYAQLKKAPDQNKITYVTTVTKNLTTDSDYNARITLPLEGKGIWYIRATIRNIVANAFIVRSDIGVLAKKGDNELIFWGQDFNTKRSVSTGEVITYNLLNGRKELQRVPFDSNGLAHTNVSKDIDVALVAYGDDRAIVPINLRYLNYQYANGNFLAKTKNSKYFVFTDRPLYRPGDTVFFKSIIRDDDDASYTIPTGNANIKISQDYAGQNPIFEKSIPLSKDGTIDGSFQLPKDAKVGGYYLFVKVDSDTNSSYYYDGEYYANNAQFEVEFFKKPESYISLSIPQTEYISGDKTNFTIQGTYFSGQPLIGQKIKYSVSSQDFYEYEYLQDQKNLSSNFLTNFWYFNSYYGSTKTVLDGTTDLDEKGEAVIPLNTKLSGNNGKSQMFTIQTSIYDGSQEPSYAAKNIVVLSGEYGIFRKDIGAMSKVGNSISIPVVLVPNRETNISSVQLSAKIHRENWIEYQEQNKKYPSYRKEEEDLPSISTTTDSSGNATISFTPTKIGSYTITVEGKDVINNTISKAFYAYVSDKDVSYSSFAADNSLTVTADKQKYLPGDTAHLTLFSDVENRDVFLSLDRAYTKRFQIVHVNGKSATVDIPLRDNDIPNMFVTTSSFSSNSLDTGFTTLHVSPDTKRLLVTISSDSKKYGPGDTVHATVETKDYTGNPVPAEVTLWAVDKAIFELTDSKLGNIFDVFWHERSNYAQSAHSLQGILAYQPGGGGGCFAPGTKVLMADGNVKNIENVKTGDYVVSKDENSGKFVKAKVTKAYAAIDPGYLIINGSLRITPDHILNVNNEWKQAEEISIGDTLQSSQNKSVVVSSIEWQLGKFTVYNLELEKYHTFFADGIWVHNDKGLSRTVFKDVAYWNPSIQTDSSGKAEVSFVLPDNLTTWTLAAVGVAQDTKVGQTTSDIIETKDFIVRPILPNILRVGDEAVVSALVENFTDKDQKYNIALSFDSGPVAKGTYTNYLVKANSIEQVYFSVKATKENEHSKFVFSATESNDKNKGDIITLQIPVRPFSFTEKRAETGEGTKKYSVLLSQDTNKTRSSVTLSLSPSIVGSLPVTMSYLIDYPYGCVEQTTSRFVPAVIAKTNPDLYGNALKDKNLNDIIQKGVEKLSSLQGYDGGWPWWFSGRSDPYVTAYVIEYLVAAKKAGIQVEDSIFDKAKYFLSQSSYYDYRQDKDVSYTTYENVAKNYALTMMGEKIPSRVTNLENLSADYLSLAVMTNYLNGDTDPNINGLTKLSQMAVHQGDSVFWQAGPEENFGSINASTALAIRALLLAHGDKDLIQKAVRYLSQNRQYDYWSNTFATSQTIRAFTDFAKINSEANPNYTYSVSADNKKISTGNINSSDKEIGNISVPIKSNNFTVSVSKEGNGNLYETLVTKEYRTDMNARAQTHGLSVKREYFNEKGSQYSLGVGDTVIVKITVAGLESDDHFGVIADELPAGMVPVNENFKNNLYNKERDEYYWYYGISDREVTENGIVLSLYKIAKGDQVYSYRARVVSQGTFSVPPATASLMYKPEIYGMSSAQTITIGAKSEFVPVGKDSLVTQLIKAKYYIGAGIVFVAGLIFLVIRYGRNILSRIYRKLTSSFMRKPQV